MRIPSHFNIEIWLKPEITGKQSPGDTVATQCASADMVIKLQGGSSEWGSVRCCKTIDFKGLLIMSSKSLCDDSDLKWK